MELRSTMELSFGAASDLTDVLTGLGQACGQEGAEPEGKALYLPAGFTFQPSTMAMLFR